MIGLIVTGGTVDISMLHDTILSYQPDLMMAVDKGLEAFDALNQKPNLILGDFDSCDPKLIEKYKQLKTNFMTFEAEKNATDTHLAYDVCQEQGITQLYVLGWSGSRFDHALGNIFVASKYTETMAIHLIDSTNHIQFTCQELSLSKGDYPYVSLIPMTQEVTGVSTQNMKYPLYQATLYQQDTFGISNEIINEVGSVSISTGILCVIQSKD